MVSSSTSFKVASTSADGLLIFVELSIFVSCSRWRTSNSIYEKQTLITSAILLTDSVFFSLPETNWGTLIQCLFANLSNRRRIISGVKKCSFYGNFAYVPHEWHLTAHNYFYQTKHIYWFCLTDNSTWQKIHNDSAHEPPTKMLVERKKFFCSVTTKIFR